MSLRNSALLHAPLEIRVELLELAGFSIQIDEYPDFRAQQFRHHRYRHVVDAAQLVAAQLVEVGQHDRGHKDDRGILKARMLADHGGQFKPIQIRHAYIDEDQRHFVLQQAFEGFARRTGLEQILAHLGEHDLMAQQFCLLIVDQQNVDFIGGAHELDQRCSHIRSADISC